ncbi:oxidoreductase [Lachnellula occidentalis]|uniref:Oxidoreductase n=1 Tax=Lachnellula occidentalis TaxID=215460 RepID=A0A8H8RQF7_9HELO|nr:oxidoreductase [Lachnellula occidentalis]
MKLGIFAILLWSSIVAGQADYPELPTDFLHTTAPVTPLSVGFPWGSKTANNTNPCELPNPINVIRSYDFTVERTLGSPDGYQKHSLTINGQFPGPLIQANWGDTIQVTVHNKINGPDEGVALHWHGILQKESQWMDGVPGVQQCPIPPNGTFTYTFLADLYGTSWYHSHYSAQYAGGLIGPMVIYGPQTVPYAIDKGPFLLTDYYHKDYFSIVEEVMTVGAAPPQSDNNLINGKNNFNCSLVAAGDNTTCHNGAPLATTKFTSGLVHRLRLINAGAEGVQKFSIDGHNLTVIANDFVPIIPYTTNVVTLGIGQRTDVLVTGLSTPSLGGYIMRSSLAGGGCSLTNQPDATAIVYYGLLPPSTIPSTTPWPNFITSTATVCANDPLTDTVPWKSITPDPNPPTTKEIEIDFKQNATGFSLWYMNNVTFRANYNAPILLLSKAGNNTFEEEWNVENFGSNTSIRIVINNNGPGGFATHPIHLHGHNMFVLHVGPGAWDGTTIVNAANPQRRDVQLLPAGGHMVLQINADNPGAWPLHCHIAWHVSAGLYVTVLERPDDIANLPIPSIMAQTCRDWSVFTGEEVVNQIDSGL